MYVAPLRWHSFNICNVTTVQLSNGTVHKFFKQNFTFHENVSSIFFYTCTWVKYFFLCKRLASLGLDECACIYDWTWSTGLLISKKNYQLWKSVYKVNGELNVLFWYHIFWQSSVQRGWHTKLCIISFLKWNNPNLLKLLLLGFLKCFLLTQSTLLFGETSPVKPFVSW